jgi:hypothetical protein
MAQVLKEESVALSTEALYDKSMDLAKDVDDNFLDLARTLRQLYDRDRDLLKKVWEKTNLGSRKAYYLVNIDRWFGKLPVGKGRLKAIGWTKLQVIGPFVNEQNLEELLGLAENNTVEQLKALMKGEEPITNAHCVLMYFSPKQYEQLETVLLSHGGSRSGRGILNKENALMKALSKLTGLQRPQERSGSVPVNLHRCAISCKRPRND